MVTAHDQYSRIVSGFSGKLEESTQNVPSARRQWVAPTWERLETPMEVTMYVARR
jgi:hypothetical protein